MRAKDPHPPTRSLPDVLGHASAFSSQNVGSLLGMNVQKRTLQGCARSETIDVLDNGYRRLWGTAEHPGRRAVTGTYAGRCGDSPEPIYQKPAESMTRGHCPLWDRRTLLPTPHVAR